MYWLTPPNDASSDNFVKNLWTSSMTSATTPWNKRCMGLLRKHSIDICVVQRYGTNGLVISICGCLIFSWALFQTWLRTASETAMVSKYASIWYLYQRILRPSTVLLFVVRLWKAISSPCLSQPNCCLLATTHVSVVVRSSGGIGELIPASVGYPSGSGIDRAAVLYHWKIPATAFLADTSVCKWWKFVLLKWCAQTVETVTAHVKFLAVYSCCNVRS